MRQTVTVSQHTVKLRIPGAPVSSSAQHSLDKLGAIAATAAAEAGAGTACCRHVVGMGVGS